MSKTCFWVTTNPLSFHTPVNSSTPAYLTLNFLRFLRGLTVARFHNDVWDLNRSMRDSAARRSLLSSF